MHFYLYYDYSQVRVVLNDVNQNDIYGSPFQISVGPAATDATTSTAQGAGLTVGMAGVPTTFIVFPRDTFGNLRNETIFSISISGIPSGMCSIINLNSSITSFNNVSIAYNTMVQPDGSMIITYTPLIAQTYRIDIMLPTFSYPPESTSWPVLSPIVGSPFFVSVQASPVIAPANTLIKGFGLVEVRVGVPATIQVVAVDAHRNPTAVSSTSVAVSITDSVTLDDVPYTLSNGASSDGVFVTYVAPALHPLSVHVRVLNVSLDTITIPVLNIHQDVGVNLYYIYAVIGVSGVSVIFTLLYILGVYYWRNSHIMQYSKVLFLNIGLSGVLLSFGAIILRFVTPTSFICMLLPWFDYLPGSLVLGTLWIKIRRVSRLLEEAKKFRKTSISEKQMMIRLSLYVLLHVGYLSVWTILSPDTAQSNISTSYDAVMGVNVHTTSVTCENSNQALNYAGIIRL